MCRTLTTVLVLAISALPAAGIQPRPSGRFLTDDELQNITSIECLKARQHDIHARCDQLGSNSSKPVSANSTANSSEPSSEPSSSNETRIPAPSAHAVKVVPKMVPEFTMVNYPNYEAKICHSNGSYFCDPYEELTESDRQILAVDLVNFQQQHLVTCPSIDREPVSNRHLQPFYLGVVLAKELSDEIFDSASLKEFGQVILADWNMARTWASSAQVTRCPNTALLMVLPQMQKVVLVSESESCDFICDESGGPAVEAAVLTALESGQSVASAVTAGVKAVYQALPDTVWQGQAMPSKSADVPSAVIDSGASLLFAERALFAFAVCALVLSLFVGFLVMLFAPGLAKHRRM